MKRSRVKPWLSWTAESSMTSLLFFFLAYLFTVCSLNHFAWGDFVADLLFSCIIVTGVLATFKKRWLHIFAIILAMANITLTWELNIHPGGSLLIIATILRLIILGFLVGVLIIQVFGAGPVTGHRIRGAIALYLICGGVWSLAYFLVNLIIPSSFHFPAEFNTADHSELGRILTYFSYTTLTTCNFGDIIPANALTRTLAMFEAIAGQIYLVTILGRLVSLGTAPPQKQ